MNEIIKNDQNSEDLLDLTESKKGTYARFAMAALGSIPWVGGFIAGTAAYTAEREQGRINENIQTWMNEHHQKIEELYKTLSSIAERIEGLGDEAKARIEEDDYLDLVKKGFRIWDKSETQDKRELKEREVNHLGQFIKKSRRVKRTTSSNLMKSSFDDDDRHELTELGKEFVHYVLSDSVSRIEG